MSGAGAPSPFRREKKGPGPIVAKRPGKKGPGPFFKLSTGTGRVVSARGKRFAVVASRFNEYVTRQLADGAVDTLVRHGARRGDIRLTWVPGAFELPLAAAAAARDRRTDAVLCLGVIIRGGTPHFEYIASQAAAGIAQVALASRVPVLFGVLTTETPQQAVARAGGALGNKGCDVALAAIAMTRVAPRRR